MKIIYSLILLIICALGANAQSLTYAANAPVVGNIYQQSAYDSTTVLNNATGQNMTWDFSSLSSFPFTEAATYTTVASTSYAANFPSATIAVNDEAGGYIFYKSTSSQYEWLGKQNANLAINFSNTAVVAVWPIAYNYSNTDVATGTANVQGQNGTAAATITTQGTGTGTLIIPGGAVFNNVLQTRTTQTVYISAAGGSYTANLKNTNISYYHSSQKFPILNIEFFSSTGTFPNSPAVDIRINNAVITGINDLNFDATFAVYPNPAKSMINIKLNNGNNSNCTVEIVNALGEVTKNVNLGNDSEIFGNISISDLAPGIYMVKTTLGNKISARKLIIE